MTPLQDSLHASTKVADAIVSYHSASYPSALRRRLASQDRARALWIAGFTDNFGALLRCLEGALAQVILHSHDLGECCCCRNWLDVLRHVFDRVEVWRSTWFPKMPALRTSLVVAAFQDQADGPVLKAVAVLQVQVAPIRNTVLGECE